MRETRAIVFDLDDTLYPYRAFVRSGFKAVGARLAEEHGLPVASVLRVLRRARAGGERGRELQALCARFALPTALLPSLVALMRDHEPSLRLPRESLQVLGELRASWKVGLLTNGAAAIQRRKVEALGVDRLVDAVVYATEDGGAAKPAPSAFHTVLDRLRASPAAAVFVGDDAHADIAGATAVGMKPIHLLAYRGAADVAACGCGRHVERLTEVPVLANALVPAGAVTYAM